MLSTHGSTYHKINVGQISDVATFSFYPGKNLGAYSESGCAITNVKKLNDKIRKLRNWGKVKSIIMMIYLTTTEWMEFKVLF